MNRKERIEFQTSGVLREGCNWGKKSGWVSLSALATESILSAKEGHKRVPLDKLPGNSKG